ncbi:MAG TPA: caspase family protein [Saprospiraceae bacterium]|nr:caspase family protein [Saprospiraceae bacterium]
MHHTILGEANTFIRRRNWFLGIGINDYQEFPKLHNAIKDVEDIKQVLLSQYDFDPQYIIMLYDEAASIEGIIGTLDTLAEKLSKDDTLLIYYSGHGHLSQKELGYWIPYDAKRGNTARYIANSRLRDAIATFDAQHVLLISDSCFSGSLLSRGASRSSRLIRELDTSPSRWALCSGRGDEEVDDGVPGDNSPFAKSILTVLKDPSEDEINISRLVDRVREQVAANSYQIPEGHPMQGVNHAWGEYIFRKKSALAEQIRSFNTQTVSENQKKKKDNISGPLKVNIKPRYLKWSKRTMKMIAIIGIGTSLIALWLVFFPPKSPDAMQLTVFVTDKAGNVVLENEGRLNIPLGNRSLNAVIGAEGRTHFPDIAGEYKGDTIEIALDAEGWVIAVDAMDRNQFVHNNLFVFTGEPLHLKVERDPILRQVRGSVKSIVEGGFLKGAIVLINNEFSVETDSMGFFDFMIPEAQISDRYNLSIQKEGYETKSLYYYPATGAVDIRLNRK